jgi:hypothetical protein
MFGGISHALSRVARCAYVLFLEEDFVSLLDGREGLARIDAAIRLMESDARIVQVRLRNNAVPGPPMHARIAWESTGSIESTHRLWATTWTDKPDAVFPEDVWPCSPPPRNGKAAVGGSNESLHWCTTTLHADWSTFLLPFPLPPLRVWNATG